MSQPTRRIKHLPGWKTPESLESPEPHYGRRTEQTEMFALVMGSVEIITATPQGHTSSDGGREDPFLPLPLLFILLNAIGEAI